MSTSPSTPIFDLIARYHSNAEGCQTTHVVIDFPPIAAISRACTSIFAQIDRDDPVQRAAARDAWLLKSSLALTALPFGDPRLALDEITGRLVNTSHGVPGLRSPVNDLKALVRQLAEGNKNPKRDRLIELLQAEGLDPSPIAILANVCGSPTPGWPVTITAPDDFQSSQAELVRQRKQTKRALYSRALIPGNPFFAPRHILFDLLYGGRARSVVIVSYKAERVLVPAPKKLPLDSFFPAPAPVKKPLVNNFEALPDSGLDEWAQDTFWSSIRAQHEDLAPVSDRDMTVDATFVLFGDSSGAFLPSEGRVVEVGELFEEGADFDVTEDRLPRTLVRDLEEGDLVMLRLSGSGDYLDDVADTLIRQAGDTDLRARALQWKDRLHETIKRQGEGVVAAKVRDLGVHLKSPQYLWTWAGEAVMAPHNRATFKSLITAISQLDSRWDIEQPDSYADARWTDMERLKAYHHKAGSVIRAALLKRVRDLVSERRRIQAAELIELPGVAAGRMGLLRVAAIDVKTKKVPASRLFHLTKVRGI